MPALAASRPTDMADVVDLSYSSPTEPDSSSPATSTEPDFKGMKHDPVGPEHDKAAVEEGGHGYDDIYDAQMRLAPLYGAIRYAEPQSKKLPNAHDFAAPCGVATSKEVQNDLQDFGFGKVQARQMITRRETETDGHMQRTLRREGSSLSQSGLSTAQPERRGRAGKAAVTGTKYAPLRLGENESNWMLFDPSKADQLLMRSLPPLLKTFASYAPGNTRVLEYNVVSENVRIRHTPKNILDKSIDFTPQGPKIVNVINARRKTERQDSVPEQTNKRAAEVKSEHTKSKAQTSPERAIDSTVPGTSEPAKGKRGRPKVTTGSATDQVVSFPKEQLNVASTASNNAPAHSVLKGQGKSRVKRSSDQEIPTTETTEADTDMAKTKRRKTRYLSQARHNGKFVKSESVVVDSSASEELGSGNEQSTKQWEEIGSDGKRVKQEEEDYVIQDSQE